ncbi:HNH endonuclease signature motif containing protein [Anoxybacillus rupiensis]|uniref:HNH endonuclease signature motif containing protein n=1 Tax=Anoxybacteroides rupiense TaxID=311460 RepID=A0ABD5IT57_9BACL|nr:HNH endonuclease signature motif containing protein [Anoxybacillus rupiensis]
MNLSREFNPVPKPTKQRKEKPKPKIREKRPKKRKAKVETFKGRVIPKAKDRTKISKANYNRMIEEFGDCCMICGRTPIEAHHLVFRSQLGSGNWRNLAPLCKEHHTKAHRDYNFAEYLRQERAERFGPHFWKDKYTLFKENLIPNTTTEAYEKFMLGEEEKQWASIRENGKSLNSNTCADS